MPTFSNSPQETTLLVLEASKSFSLGLYIRDGNRVPLNVAGSTAVLTAAKVSRAGIGTVVVTNSAVILDAGGGYLRFNIQASELALAPGTYALTVTFVLAGFSVVLLKGNLEIKANTSATTSTFVGGSTTDLDVMLRESNTAHVETSTLLPPDVLHVPTGGTTGQALVKRTATAYDLVWATLVGGLSGAGQTVGKAPVTDGAGAWSWTDIATQAELDAKVADYIARDVALINDYVSRDATTLASAISAAGANLVDAVYSSNANNATANGDYRLDPVSTNGPSPGYWLLNTRNEYNSTWVWQEALSYANAVNGRTVVRRRRDGGGAWSAWVYEQTGWNPYNPAWSGLTIGNGTISAEHRRMGGLRHVRMTVSFGSTSSMGSVPFFQLPTTATIAYVFPVLLGNAGTDSYVGFIKMGGTSAYPQSLAGGYFTATVPFTWHAGDSITAAFAYLED